MSISVTQTAFFVRNLDIVFFVYGLAFVIMGVAIFVHPRKDSIFKLSDIIWLLAAFGLVHGANEWCDMFTIIKGYHSYVWRFIEVTVLGSSFVFLFEFGRRLIFLSFKNFFLTRWIAISWYSVAFAVTFLTFKHEPSIWPRYFLGFPAGLMTAFGIYFYYRNNEAILRPINVRRYFYATAVCAGAYGFLGGFVTNKAEFFPAYLINTDSFLGLVHIPVQMFRALCAIVLAWSVWNTLVIFNWEIREKLKKEISEREQAEKKIREALQVESEFLSMISHEVRTPLTSLKESIAIVSDGSAGDLTSEQKDFLEVARRNVERLNRFINSVLVYRKLEAGRMEFDMREANINAVVRDVKAGMDALAKSRGLALTMELEENLPDIIFDEDRIAQVLTNLVENAVKFTDKGSIVIKTSRRDDSVCVSVTDTGSGIQHDALPKLFLSFRQVTSERDKKMVGSGLGLAISKRIIAMHKGDIWVESEYGKGSTFYFCLPTKERKG